MKTIHFLGGLPRTGSSLLSSLLNEHPLVYAGRETDLFQKIDSHYNANGIFNDAAFYELNNIAQDFYGSTEKTIVIDKNGQWGSKNSINLAGYISPSPKFLMTIRPILDILASFVILAKNNPNNFIDKKMNEDKFLPARYRNIDDARCDWLMRPYGHIDFSLEALSNAKLNPSMFKVIDYDGLIKNSALVMKEVYSFLGVSVFENNFASIKEIPTDNDVELYGIKDMHKVRPTLSKSSTNYENVLSDYAIEKYQNALDFLN
jgi:sulfotransferase